MNPIQLADAKREAASGDAQAQALEFDNQFAGDVFAAEIYTAPNGDVFTVPNLGALEDEQQERFNALQHKFTKCDKAPPTVVPERTITNAEGVVTHFPERTIETGYLQPYQIDGELVSPSYNVQFTMALLGEGEYEKFKAAKGKSSEFTRKVLKLAEVTEARVAADKSVSDGVDGVAAVPD